LTESVEFENDIDLYSVIPSMSFSNSTDSVKVSSNIGAELASRMSNVLVGQAPWVVADVSASARDDALPPFPASPSPPFPRRWRCPHRLEPPPIASTAPRSTSAAHGSPRRWPPPPAAP